jgi:hypothetical protein
VSVGGGLGAAGALGAVALALAPSSSAARARLAWCAGRAVVRSARASRVVDSWRGAADGALA